MSLASILPKRARGRQSAAAEVQYQREVADVLQADPANPVNNGFCRRLARLVLHPRTPRPAQGRFRRRAEADHRVPQVRRFAARHLRRRRLARDRRHRAARQQRHPRRSRELGRLSPRPRARAVHADQLLGRPRRLCRGRGREARPAQSVRAGVQGVSRPDHQLQGLVRPQQPRGDDAALQAARGARATLRPAAVRRSRSGRTAHHRNDAQEPGGPRRRGRLVAG